MHDLPTVYRTRSFPTIFRCRYLPMDPLTLVRKATMSRATIAYEQGDYIFGPYRYPDSTKTAFKRSLKGADQENYYYTLRDVIFFLENADVSIPEYRRKVVEARNVIAVVEADKANLKKYLQGVIDSCTQIDMAALVTAPISSQAATVATSSSQNIEEETSGPSIDDLSMSKDEIEEHRLRYATMLDSRSSHAKGLAIEPAAENSKKRKAIPSLEAVLLAGQIFDPSFIQVDRRMLSKVRKSEMPAHTRSTVLQKTSADFSFALKLFNDHVLKPKNLESKVPTSKTAFNKNQATNSKNLNIKVTPIIVVPSALTSLITMLNVSDFLGKGVFISVDEKTKEGAVKEREIQVQRMLPGGRQIMYRVVDNPVKLSEDDWQKVVVVFVTGQAWQFKDWKWSNPVELFQHVLGMHLTMDDRAINPTVLSWNCKLLKVNQSKRHLDAGAVNDFWASVDDFMKQKKPLFFESSSKR